MDIRCADDNDIYGQGVTLTANWQRGCSSCIPWLSPASTLPTTDHSRLSYNKDGDNVQNNVGDYQKDGDRGIAVENDHKDGGDDENVHDAPPAFLHLGRDKTQRCQKLTTACYQTFCRTF